MARRPVDNVALQTGRGSIGVVQNVELAQDYHDVANLSISSGDDRSWRAIAEAVHPGRLVQLYLNGRLVFTGRWEENDTPGDSGTGMLTKAVARTRMSDAHYASADPATKFEGVSIRQFIAALFKPLGFKPSDFLFDQNAERNLLTGERTGAPAPIDLEPLQDGKAKVQAGETILEASVRHLKRHRLLMWDGADGRLVVGRPNDTQAPIYRFMSKRPPSNLNNNVEKWRRLRDWSEAPSQVEVLGNPIDDDDDPKPIRGVAFNPALLAMQKETGHFYRRLVIPQHGTTTAAKAAAMAKRELGNRSKKMDGWELAFDGWTLWNGARGIPFAIDTTADVDIDSIGAEGCGRYLINRIVRTIDVHGSSSTRLWCVAPGILVA